MRSDPIFCVLHEGYTCDSFIFGESKDSCSIGPQRANSRVKFSKGDTTS